MREKYAQKFINIIREWTRIIMFASVVSARKHFKLKELLQNRQESAG